MFKNKYSIYCHNFFVSLYKAYSYLEIYATRFLKKLHTYFTTISTPQSSMETASLLYFSSVSSVSFIESPLFNSPYFINIYIVFTNHPRYDLVKFWHLRLWNLYIMNLWLAIIFLLYLIPHTPCFLSLLMIKFYVFYRLIVPLCCIWERIGGFKIFIWRYNGIFCCRRLSLVLILAIPSPFDGYDEDVDSWICEIDIPKLVSIYVVFLFLLLGSCYIEFVLVVVT